MAGMSTETFCGRAKPGRTVEPKALSESGRRWVRLLGVQEVFAPALEARVGAGGRDRGQKPGVETTQGRVWGAQAPSLPTPPNCSAGPGAERGSCGGSDQPRGSQGPESPSGPSLCSAFCSPLERRSFFQPTQQSCKSRFHQCPEASSALQGSEDMLVNKGMGAK